MAENPITSDSLTINFADLMRIPVSDRAILAQQSPQVTNSLIATLSPIQIAKAFPDYYRKELPDISNFILANRYLDDKGKGAFTQQGGGEQGTRPTAYYGGEVKLSPEAQPKPVPPSTVERIMKEAGIAQTVDTSKGATPEITKQYLLDAMNKQNVNDPEIRSALAAVVQGETGFIPRSEDSYAGSSASRIREVFRRTGKFDGMSDDEINNLKKDPVAFFNKVYGGRLGNDPNEGYKYRGRGMIQLTGKENYARYGNLIGIDLVNNPDLANDPKIAAQISVAYIKDRYDSAPGPNKKEKVFRAVGAAVSGTEEIKNSSFQTFMNSGEFAPGKQANIEEQAAAAVDEMKGPAALAVSPDLQDFINSDPEMKEKFGKDSRLASQLQKAVDDGKITIDRMKTIVSEAKTTAEAIKNVSGEISEDPYEFWKSRNPRGASFVGADGKPISRELLTTTMMAVKKFEAENPGKRVEVYGRRGGVRQTSETTKSQHLLGHALDMAIYEIDPQTGKTIDMGGSNDGNYPNFPDHGGGLSGTVEASGLYDQLQENVELARIYKAEIEGDQSYRYGVRSGTFFPGKYSLDNMHTDIGGTLDASGLSNQDYGYGNLLTGASEALLREKGIDPSSPAGQELMTGILEKYGGTKEGVVEAAVKAYAPKTNIVPAKELPSNSTADIPASTEATPAPNIVPQKDSKAPEELTSPVEGTSVPAFRTGGSPEVQDDENLTAVDADGKPKFKFNTGEGLYVKPEGNEYADKKMAELSDRIDQIDQQKSQQTDQPTRNINSNLKPEPDTKWRKNIANAVFSPGTQGRAFNRAKFRNEGWHWGRSSPNSTTT